MTDTPTTTSLQALQAQADALLRNNEALIKATARMANQRDDALVLARDAKAVLRAVIAESDTRDAWERDPRSAVLQAKYDAAVKTRRRLMSEWKAANPT